MTFIDLASGLVGYPLNSLNGAVAAFRIYAGALSPEQVQESCHASVGRFAGASCPP